MDKKALIFLATIIKVIVCNPNPFYDWQYPKYEEQMEISYNPCEDFFQYACGNWRLPYSLRSLNATDTLTATRADNKRILKDYFERQNDNFEKSNLNASFQHLISNVTLFYNSCMENRFGTNLRERISIYTNIYNNPLLFENTSATFNMEQFQWEAITGKLRRYGVQSLWQVVIKPNWQASDQPIFYISSLSSEYFKKNTSNSYDELLIFFYERYIKNLMLDLGFRVREAQKIAKEVIEFEKQLIDIHIETEQFVVLKEPQSLSSLINQFPKIQFSTYFKNLLKNLNMTKYWEDKLMIVVDISYMEKLSNFLNSQTPETLSKYFLIQMLLHFQVHIHELITLFDQTQHCLKQANKFMPLHLSVLYLTLRHSDPIEFLEDTNAQITDIFEKLKLEFKNRLNVTTVFERDNVNARTSNLNKLNEMRLLLPKFQNLITQKEECSLEINNNYDLNLLMLSEKHNQREFLDVIQNMENDINSNAASLETTLPKQYVPSHTYGPLDVNAYYHLKLNAIEIPLGILRLPFYDKILLKPQLYGSFVYILAHELLHGFDYDGLNYDESGNVANNWGPKSIIDYGSKAKCYLSRYKNDALRLNENIADGEGLQLALDTFLNTNYNFIANKDDLKMFFISFAQSWCGDFHSSFHTSNRDRVNNVVANFNEFSDVFKCDEESELNPKEKCKIW